MRAHRTRRRHRRDEALRPQHAQPFGYSSRVAMRRFRNSFRTGTRSKNRRSSMRGGREQGRHRITPVAVSRTMHRLRHWGQRIGLTSIIFIAGNPRVKEAVFKKLCEN